MEKCVENIHTDILDKYIQCMWELHFCRVLERVTSVGTCFHSLFWILVFLVFLSLQMNWMSIRQLQKRPVRWINAFFLLSYIYCELSKWSPFLRIGKKMTKIALIRWKNKLPLGYLSWESAGQLSGRLQVQTLAGTTLRVFK